MMIRAIFEEGVFKPVGPVALSEGAFVMMEVQPMVPAQHVPTPEEKLTAIMSILAEQDTMAQRTQPPVLRIENRP